MQLMCHFSETLFNTQLTIIFTFMIKIFFRPLVITLGMGVFVSSALAEPLNSVATVDMQKLFAEYHLTKGAKAKVEADQALIGKENNEKLADIRKIADKIEALTKKLADGTIAPKAKEEFEHERKIEANKGNTLDSNRREWLNRRNKAINENIAVEMKKILDDIQVKVQAYASDNDIDMVFDKSAISASRTKLLTFSKDKFDVTGILLKSLNEGAK